MQRNVLRALLLAMVALMLAAATVSAQDEGTNLFERDEISNFFEQDGSVLIGIDNDVALARGEEADAVLIVQGSALIEGVTDAIVAIDADVVVKGSEAVVGGILSIGGSLTVSSGASVRDVSYVDTEVDLTGATVTGEVRDIETDLAGGFFWIIAGLAIFLFFVWIGAFIATLAAGLFMVAFGTSQARRAAWTIGNDPLKVLAVGLLAAIVPWIVFGLLAITIVGIPLAIGLAAIWGLVVFLGYLTVGLWIGERILRRSRNASRPYGAVFLGVLVLMLLSVVPFVSAIAGWFGLGAVTLAGWRVLRGRGGSPVPPGYGSPYGQPQQVPPPPYAPPPFAPPPPQGQYPPQQPPPQQPPPQQPPPQQPPPAGWG